MSWLISKALMNSLSLQEQVEEYLGDISLDGEQSVQSNGSNTQQAYCAPDKMTGFSRLSRFGMTYKPLTENRGEELLTLYREDFRVRTFQSQEKETDLKEKDQVCGKKCPALLAKYDLNTSSWKTAQCSLFEDLEQSLEIFPKWGMTVNGELFLHRMWEPTISGKEFGSWATPTTMDTLPPKSPQALNKEATIARKGRSKPANLRDQVSNMKNWPTPVTRDYKDSGSQEALIRARDKRDSPGLGLLVGAEGGGNLNPMWVEWLMGWPLGWTDLKPLEMDKCLYAQQQHGEY